MDEQMTPMSDLGLTDPQAEQDQVLQFLQQLAQLMQNGGRQAFGGANSPSINQGPLITQAMIDALAPDARERTGLLPHQTPAGIDTKPGVMSQLGAAMGPIDSNMEWMTPQTTGSLAGILGGGANTPGAITSYTGGVPTTYVPETPRGQSTQAQGQQPSSPEGLGLTEQELQAAIQGYLANGETPPEVLTGAKPAQSKGKMAPADIAKMAELSTALDKAKVPSEIKTMILQQSFPQYKGQQDEEKQTLRKETRQDQADIGRKNLREKFVMENQSNLFKRGTGESFLSLGTPPEDTEQILKDYAVLKPENAKDMRSLDMVGGYVDGFRSLLTEIKPLLSAQKQGVIGRLGAGTEISYLRAKGDARVRKMDALAAQITLLARGFGGDARVSDKEMERLDNSIINGWTTKEGADATIGILNDFITNRSNSLGFSKYKTLGQRPKTLTPAQEQKSVIRTVDKKGRKVISYDNGLNWVTE